MIDSDDIPTPRFTMSPTNGAGIATIQATGHDIPSVLEAGLRAVLALAVAPPRTAIDTGRSAPINGVGEDLESLFSDLVEDLLSQIEFFGTGLHDVVIDGVLRRENDGYVGWGHASGTLDATPQVVMPRLLGRPAISRGAGPRIHLAASLQCSGTAIAD